MRKLFVVVALLATFLFQTPANAETPIDQRYNSEPALQTLLGPPIKPEWSTNGGRMREYKHGALYYTPLTGVHEVHGAIRWEFRAHGGLQIFGFPTTDEEDVLIKDFSIGRENIFQHGVVTWDSRTGSHWMDSTLGQAWHENIYPYLNMPTTDQRLEGDGWEIFFYDAAIHERPDHTTWITWPAWTGL